MDFWTIKISNSHNSLSIGPKGLKFCMQGSLHMFSMRAKFQPLRTNRKRVMAIGNFDCSKIHQRTILKNLIRNHLVAVCPPGSWILAIWSLVTKSAPINLKFLWGLLMVILNIKTEGQLCELSCQVVRALSDICLTSSMLLYIAKIYPLAPLSISTVSPELPLSYVKWQGIVLP